MFRLIALTLTLIALCLTPTATLAKRVALVIGNAAYGNVAPLTNPVNDSADLAAALERLGFDVTLARDASGNDMRRLFRDFSRDATGAELSLIYFAGHGIEIEKKNYLIPVDAELQSDQDVAFEAIALDQVTRSLERTGGISIVLVDACRNNPFATRMRREGTSRSLMRGLARVDPAGGVLVGYAAREGTVALDGEGRNSPYAQALLEHLEEPGLEIGKLFRKIRDRVYALTNGNQEPFTYGSLPGTDIYFKPPTQTPAISAAAPAPAASAPVSDKALVDDFASAQTTDTLAGWSAFLDAHGASTQHPLVRIAIRRRDALRAESEDRQRALDTQPWLTPEAGLPQVGEVTLTRSERVLVQKALLFMGHDPGGVDGQFGPNTRKAIASARLKRGLGSGVHVDRALLTALPNVPAIEALQSPRARSYSDAELAKLDEPRLQAALQALSGKDLLFGYFGGHLYIAVRNQTNWPLARKAAEKAGGHLVTLNSAAENQFVYALFSQDDRLYWTARDGMSLGPHIGLIQLDKSREPAGGWAWVTGEPLTYRNWSRGNPDNNRGHQDFGGFYRSAKDRNRLPGPSKWDDSSNTNRSYIVEIE